MKKLNNLTSIFAIVLMLGITSCSETDEPTPNPVDGITLSDFDGLWISESVTYQNETYDKSTACTDLNHLTWQLTDFDIRSADGAITFTDVCRNFPRDWDVTFDSETLIIKYTIQNSTNNIQWQITEHDLTSSKKTATIRLIHDSVTINNITVGIYYHIVRQ